MRDFEKDLELVKNFCGEYSIGFGAEDKDDNDESLYTIAYEIDVNTIFFYLTEDETEEADQIILDTIVVRKNDDIDVVSVLLEKCKVRGIII